MTQPNGDFTPRTRDGVSLKDYIDKINDVQCAKCAVCRKGIDGKFVSTKDAVDLALHTTDQKFNNVNEWRTTHADLVLHKIDRHEYEESHLRLEDKLEQTERHLQGQIKSTAANFESERKGIAANLAQLNVGEATLAGKASQKSVTWSYVFSGLTLLLAIVAIIVVIILK